MSASAKASMTGYWMFPSAAHGVPTKEIHCDFDYQILCAQALPGVHRSYISTQTNDFIPGIASYCIPKVNSDTSWMLSLIIVWLW